MRCMNLYESLLDRSLYSQVIKNLELKAKTVRYLKDSAPIEPSFSLRWCLNNSEKLIDYYIDNLRKEKYFPQDRLQRSIIKDKERKIYTINWVDKIFDLALSTVLFKACNNIFSSQLYSHRKGYSNRKGVKFIASYLESIKGSKVYILKADIKAYNESIDTDILLSQINEVFKNQISYFNCLLKDFFSPAYYNPILDRKEKMLSGVPTGSCLSNFAGNFYMREVDLLAESGVDAYLRYGDDLIFCDKDKNRLEKCYLSVLEILTKLKLEINQNKIWCILLQLRGPIADSGILD
jgi:hypothetical protein